ncbi:ParB/RepB/Spo0J family partition protein [Asticcacaulis taihuensis]|uniref:ParB/RepB/Spo0J family partition protein n=1 Tax=Asticcacaulis taihuensis TaxID=260084 RepID=UPI0026EA72A7|nr:ParB/RepB/Spo0J family partition protein [Asticcacaulis taihuensis]
MTKSTKITLSGIRDIPFSKLQLSQANVRRIEAGISIEDLAEDIARRGLLQSLNVRAVVDDAGVETGMFEVPAGGRRFRALERLVKQKRLAKDAPIPCIIREDGLGEEDSLAENVQRIGLHPIDQFNAFKTLADKGLSEEDIAARFFVPANVVKQRLRLADVSQMILAAYQAGDISLEHVMAFTVNPDKARQETVFEKLQASRDLGTYRIKRLMTETTVDASDKRVVFIGLDAYIEAGGTVMRDLFTEDNGGWLADPALLDKLVGENLEQEAEPFRATGWKWVETAVDFPYGHQRYLDGLIPAVPMLSDDDSAKLKSAVDEYNQLVATHEFSDGGIPDGVVERIEILQTMIDDLENPEPVYKSEDIEIGGVFLSINRDGTLLVDEGYVRPEDRRPEPNAPDDEGEDSADDASGDLDDETSEGTGCGSEDGSQVVGTTPAPEPEDTAIKPLPEILHRELTAYRTLVMRDALARNPAVALTALLHKLCMDHFYSSYLGDCMEIRITSSNLAYQGPDLKDSPAAQSIAARASAWRDTLPEDDAQLWQVLSDLSDDSRAQLLAHFVSSGLNAMYEPAAKPGYNGPSVASIQHRLKGADRIAAAVNLDLVAAGWAPSVENYLGRVPKARILLAVEQGCGADFALRINDLKKDDMAAQAEAWLKTSGWLPEPLLSPVTAVTPQPPADAETHADVGAGEPTENPAEYAEAAE